MSQRSMDWPPEEPDGPHTLDTDIDYMTFSHQELYDMVHDGLSLAGATSVAAQWAKLGDALDEIGADLRKAVQESTDGWQGEAAEAARGTVNRLVDWTVDTANRGKDVSGCVSRQADNAETARRTMPEPLIRSRPPVYTTSAGAFSGAEAIVYDPGPDRVTAQELHQEAAGVMRRLQSDSAEVYGRVPNFTQPMQDAPPPTDGDPEPPPEPQQEGTTTASSAAPVAAPAGGASAPLPPGGRSGTISLEPGGLTSTSQPAGTALSPAASPAAQRGTTGPVGGMPMGGAAAQRGQEDDEHKSPAYLQEDSDFWNAGVVATPPVIGEDPRA